jgi:predicted RNase H-like HicB family nuclease
MSDLTPPISLSIVYEPVEGGWIQARIEGIPEVITAGPSKDEARELVLDALREYLASIEGNGDPVDRERVDLVIARG